jgi:serine/threonine protein phosphatase PrpC
MHIGNAQWVGERDRQEDYLAAKAFADLQLAVLADGMGGHADGDQASQLVVQGFLEFVQQQHRRYLAEDALADLLLDAAFSANGRLAQMRASDMGTGNMGATLVALAICRGQAWWLSVGDSLLYLWRDGSLQRLNSDQNYYQELRQRVFLGELSSAEAIAHPERASLSSALMGEVLRSVELSRIGLPLQPGDSLLLASDGLASLPSERWAALFKATGEPQALADDLVEAVKAQAQPGQDNVSVLLLQPFAETGQTHSTGMNSTDTAAGRRPRWLGNGLLLGLLLLVLIFSLARWSQGPQTEPEPQTPAPKTPATPQTQAPVLTQPQANDHGASRATPENESLLAPIVPSPQPPPEGRGSNRALRDFHSKASDCIELVQAMQSLLCAKHLSAEAEFFCSLPAEPLCPNLTSTPQGNQQP